VPTLMASNFSMSSHRIFKNPTHGSVVEGPVTETDSDKFRTLRNRDGSRLVLGLLAFNQTKRQGRFHSLSLSRGQKQRPTKSRASSLLSKMSHKSGGKFIGNWFSTTATTGSSSSHYGHNFEEPIAGTTDYSKAIFHRDERREAELLMLVHQQKHAVVATSHTAHKSTHQWFASYRRRGRRK
jgi:hypothetical protein